ncbi:MAG: MFS transporter [Rudaea sp.]
MSPLIPDLEAAAAPPHPGRRRVAMAAVISTAAIFGLTYGLTAPLIAVSLAARGAGESLIGLNAAMHAVGVLMIATVLPRLTARFGQRTLIVAALLASATLLVSFPLIDIVWLWFPLRLLLGAAAEVLLVLSETWTNGLSSPQARGRTMAAYMAALSLGFAGGPAILAVVGTGKLAFFIGAAISLLAVLPVISPWTLPPPAFERSTRNAVQFMRLAPIAIATTVLNAAVETAGLSFIALYASGMGWSETQAMALVSTLMVGAIVMQLPIGWLADHMPRQRLVLILAVISALGALCWPWLLGTSALAYAVVFVWGGLFVGIYTVMLAVVGERFSGGDLVGVYAVMGLAWGAGALVGPTVVGFAMQASPTYGLPYSIAAGGALFALLLAVRRHSA